MYIESETKVLYGNHFLLINIIRIGMIAKYALKPPNMK